MNGSKNNLQYVLLLVFLVLLSSCSKSDESPSVTSISLSKSSLIVTMGATDSLQVNYFPKEASKPTYVWQSSNENIATIKEGVIVPISEGVCTITVTIPSTNIKSTCIVTVIPIKPDSIQIDSDSLSLYIGEKTKLTANVYPATAKDKTVYWYSSNTRVATIDNAGNIIAVGEGTAKLTAKTKVGNITTSCNIRVLPIKVESIVLKSHYEELILGQTKTILATIAPTNATHQNITWTSQNNLIVTFVEGVLTAKGVGTAFVYASSETKKDSCKVIVKSNNSINYNPYDNEQRW